MGGIKSVVMLDTSTILYKKTTATFKGQIQLPSVSTSDIQGKAFNVYLSKTYGNLSTMKYISSTCTATNTLGVNFTADFIKSELNNDKKSITVIFRFNPYQQGAILNVDCKVVVAIHDVQEKIVD